MIAVAVLALLALLALSVPVAAALGAIGLGLGWTYSMLPLYRGIAEIAWNAMTDPLMVTIPLFVLMGEVLLRSGIAANMYRSAALWLSWLPGGLMHSNIGSSALFATVSGSSVATAATIGTVAVGEIDKHGYNERTFLGSIAAGGTIGILIPPVDQHDCLWRTDRYLDPAALSRRLPAGACADRCLHGDNRTDLPAEAGLWRAGRSRPTGPSGSPG